MHEHKSFSLFLISVVTGSILMVINEVMESIVACANSFIFFNYFQLLILVLIMYYHYNTRLNYFIDAICADFPSNKCRLFISYNIYSATYNMRVLLSIIISQFTELDSLINVFPAIN